MIIDINDTLKNKNKEENKAKEVNISSNQGASVLTTANEATDNKSRIKRIVMNMIKTLKNNWR